MIDVEELVRTISHASALNATPAAGGVPAPFSMTHIRSTSSASNTSEAGRPKNATPRGDTTRLGRDRGVAAFPAHASFPNFTLLADRGSKHGTTSKLGGTSVAQLPTSGNGNGNSQQIPTLTANSSYVQLPGLETTTTGGRGGG